MMPPQSEMKPTLHVPATMLKDAKDWKVGKKYVLEVEVEMTGQNKEPDGDICLDFTVKKLKPLGEKSALTELSKRYD